MESRNRYEDLREIARGASGVVFSARDTRLGRRVALKVLANSHDRDRFEREARALAALQHPDIVPIFELTELDGRPCIVMGLVEGGTLEARLDSKPMAPRGAAELLLKVCRPVAHAHAKGFVHRDLKPANILFTERGEPKVGDFGLAKLVGDRSDLTATGALVGTPLYMAPEQANGRGKNARPTADVFALGAILYELLTGRPAFRGESLFETLRLVIGADPAPPRSLSAAVPADLQAVCLMCLEKYTYLRYADAGELALDLQRFLDGRPTAARRPGVLGRAWLWARRGLAAWRAPC